MNTRLTKSLVLCCVLISITGCSLLQPYQAELTQGNFLREEQVNQLALGQTPKQVLFLLGTPLISGELRNQRWIYPTHNEADGYGNLIIWFENGVVSEITNKKVTQK